jgi:hypothetical protein
MELTRRNIIIGGTATLIVSTIIFLLYNRSKKIDKEKEINDILNANIKDPSQTNAGQVIIKAEDVSKLPNGNFPIKFGDKSKKVYAIQQALNKTYGKSIDLDGKYGESTFVTLCSNLWNRSGEFGVPTTYETSCINHGVPTMSNPSGRTRRMITQKDYDAVVSHHNFTGDIVEYEMPNIPNAVVVSNVNY